MAGYGRKRQYPGFRKNNSYGKRKRGISRKFIRSRLRMASAKGLRRIRSGYRRRRSLGTFTVPRRFLRPFYDSYTTGETELSATKANELNIILTGYDLPILNQQAFADMLNKFDEYKLWRVDFEFWLQETDEWSESNYVLPRLYHVYDTNSRIDVNAQPKDAGLLQRSPYCTMKFMRPGQKYRYTIYPKYALETQQTTSASGAIVPANQTASQYTTNLGSPWRISGYASNTTINCMNCHYISIQGKFPVDTKLIRQRRIHYYIFRKRRNYMASNEA